MATSHIKFTTSFNAEKWFRENLRNAPSLKPKSIKTVAGFTLLWNLFEGIICDTNASVDRFYNITRNLTATPINEESINKSLSFYRKRYLHGQVTNERFDELRFRNGDRKEFVKSVLEGRVFEIDDKVLALLIIAYRIRNNLFHGLKSVGNWDNQAKNISEASRILSIIIEAKGGYIIQKQHLTREDLSSEN